MNSTRLFVSSVVWKFVPVIVTEVPAVPIVGVTLEIVGAGDAATVKVAPLVAEPDGVVTAMAPEVAPDGTVTVN